jgi:two-component system, cell cycle response regulator
VRAVSERLNIVGRQPTVGAMGSIIGKSTSRAVRAALSALLVGVVAHLSAGLAGYGATPLIGTWLYNGLEVVAAAVLAIRVVVDPRQRLAWGMLAGYVAMTAAADITWSALAVDGELAPGSAADVLYYAAYPLAYAGVVLLLRGRSQWFTAAMWLDGLVGGLTLASVTAAVVLTPVLASGGADAGELALTAGYVICDLLLLCFVGLAAGLSGWKPGRSWSLIGVSLMSTAFVDAAYAYQEATGTYAAESVLGTLWPAGMVALAFAAWQPQRTTNVERASLAGAVMPAVFAAIALAVVGISNWYGVTDAAVVLGLAALVAVAARGVLTYRENLRLLRRSQREALVDALTGLGNRRQLMADIDEAMVEATAGRPHTLVFFDLDGFKGYNDSFGHNAGDALLHRLGNALSHAVSGYGAAYRLGGDEFCVLIHAAVGPHSREIAAATAALSESGEGFHIGASFGVVSLPADAQTTALALQLADERMYAQKGSRRTSAKRQTRDILLQVLGERQPELRHHMDHVAHHAVATARQLGLSGEAIDEVARAAELHDIGKIAIPDSVLTKPGPLDASEWALIHQHTVIGERILLAAPALKPVAALVRASHERWDGNGYPDRLTAEAIPLGARIVAVCDAYDAMTSERGYRAALPHPAAIAELRRCAGTQFDPTVVEAFIDTLARGTRDARAGDDFGPPAAVPESA